MNETELIEATVKVMTDHNIKTRDTWLGLDKNLDDYYANGNKYNGPRRFKINYLSDDKLKHIEVGAERTYQIPNHDHLAYNLFEIKVPQRMKGNKHALVHETVHFLQTSTDKEEDNYIKYNENNYKEYLSQRHELEAHFVQVAFILSEPELTRSLSSQDQAKLIPLLKGNNKLELILEAKNIGII